MTHQVKFDKVYLEFATNGQQVNEATLDPMKKFFIDHGILVSAATVTGGSYADQRNLDRMKNVAETAARHFDELILDDWFFTSSKNAADIAAKGTKSWTQYRLEALDNASVNQLIKPGKAINPKFRLIIKYPNWYEHYQGLGYDLEVEPKIFDAIYTGVETRDPIYTEQHLQQYESYSLVRYLENVKPGGNDGVWVDKLMTRYIDRYAEQIWDAAFAKPKEITLWQWPDAASRINIGTRPWESLDTSLNYKKMLATYKPPAGSNSEATTGHVAGYALEQLDTFLDKLGKPIGIPAYRPPHAIGEEFLHDYLGMIGIPIDLHPAFPETGGNVCILTEGAEHDPDIVKKIKARLAAGSNVVITSGLLRAQWERDRGHQRVRNHRPEGRRERVHGPRRPADCRGLARFADLLPRDPFPDEPIVGRGQRLRRQVAAERLSDRDQQRLRQGDVLRPGDPGQRGRSVSSAGAGLECDPQPHHGQIPLSPDRCPQPGQPLCIRQQRLYRAVVPADRGDGDGLGARRRPHGDGTL